MDRAQLDDGQRAAVTEADGPHLVVAGAGVPDMSIPLIAGAFAVGRRDGTIVGVQ